MCKFVGMMSKLDTTVVSPRQRWYFWSQNTKTVHTTSIVMKLKSHLHTPTCVLGPRFCNPRPESHCHGRSTGYFRRRQSLSTLSIGLRGHVRVYPLSVRNSSSDHAVGSQYSYYIPLDVCVSLAARPPR